MVAGIRRRAAEGGELGVVAEGGELGVAAEGDELGVAAERALGVGRQAAGDGSWG